MCFSTRGPFKMENKEIRKKCNNEEGSSACSKTFSSSFHKIAPFKTGASLPLQNKRVLLRTVSCEKMQRRGKENTIEWNAVTDPNNPMG